MTEDAMISLLSAAARIACGRMTPQHLNALHASVERASCLSARLDWERKVTAHGELFTTLHFMGRLACGAGSGRIGQAS
jgi:DNA-binding GntR family transcriptional regulator